MGVFLSVVIPAVGLIVLALLFGWALLIVAGIVLLPPGSGQNTRRGIKWIVGGLVWMAVSPGTWLCVPVRLGSRHIAPDGVSAVWVGQGWGHSHWIRWRSPGGDGDLCIGPAPDLFYSPRPADLVWLRGSDAFYIGWTGEPLLPEPPVVEVASGARRNPTPDEVEWLLRPGRLQVDAQDYLQEMAVEQYGYTPRDAPD